MRNNETSLPLALGRIVRLDGLVINEKKRGNPRMSDVQYKVAKTVREAASLMLAAKGKGRILAGGTDLLVQMKSGMVAPGVIVDVKKIPQMTTITQPQAIFPIHPPTPP